MTEQKTFSENNPFTEHRYPKKGTTVSLTPEFRSEKELRQILDRLTNWIPRPLLNGVAFLAADVFAMFMADPQHQGRLVYTITERSAEAPKRAPKKKVELQYEPLGPPRGPDDLVRILLAPEEPSPDCIQRAVRLNPLLANVLLAKQKPSTSQPQSTTTKLLM